MVEQRGADASDEASEEVLAACLEDFHSRRGLGEDVTPEGYRSRLGEDFGTFLELLAAESLLDDEGSPFEELPRPFGPYTLLRRLGRGAMGVVYEAVHRDLGRRVALKLLFFGHEPTLRARFQREARATAQVRHDHIVEIYEAGEVEGQLYYAMAYVEGKPLSSVLRSDARPSHEALAEQVAHVADALHALHEARIVHRDVKPSNLIFDREGRLVLADFGLARTAESETLTSTGDALGTPLYMSPEQVLGRLDEVDGRSDVYGLGVALYEAATGSAPFRHENPRALMKLVLSEAPPPPSRIDPTIPEKLERIILTCMEKRAEDRYATAAALAADLRAFVAGDEVKGRPVSIWRHRLRRILSRPLRAGAVALAAGLLVAWFATRPSTGTLDIKGTWPRLSVSVDDGRFEPVPVVKEVEAGLHVVRARAPGCKDRSRPVECAAGAASYVYFDTMQIENDAPDVLEAAAQAFDIASHRRVDRDKQLRMSRSVRNFDVALLWPRGAVRPADVGPYRIELGDDYYATGRVEFRRGTETLFVGEPVKHFVHEGRVPEAVARRLRPGDVVTWGFHPTEGGKPITTTLHVVADDLAEDRARLDQRLADPDAPQPPWAVAYFRAQQLAGASLWTAAQAVLTGAHIEAPGSKERVSANATLARLEGEALEALADKDGRTLRKTRYWQALKARHDALRTGN